MLIGIASGTYSSIFIASPVLTAWKEREPGFVRRRAADRRSRGGARAAPIADDVAMAKLADDDEAEAETAVEPEDGRKPSSRRRARAGRPARWPRPSGSSDARGNGGRPGAVERRCR